GVSLIASISVSSFVRVCHARALHSFPTRRSSDLENFVDSDAPAAMPPVGTFSVYVWKSPLSPPTLLPVWSLDTLVRPQPPCSPIDRKSTRLNSSHVKISYAVFCLKKKNIQQRLKT